MTSGLNDSPTFIAALADLVANAIGVDSDQAIVKKRSAWWRRTKAGRGRGRCPHPSSGAKLRRVCGAERRPASFARSPGDEGVRAYVSSVVY